MRTFVVAALTALAGSVAFSPVHAAERPTQVVELPPQVASLPDRTAEITRGAEEPRFDALATVLADLRAQVAADARDRARRITGELLNSGTAPATAAAPVTPVAGITAAPL